MFLYSLCLSANNVLIETLWNVKSIACSIDTAVPCINRNIVECKAKNTLEELARSTVLIETLWNVK